MYFTVTVYCWCMELQHECWMRLTYRREYITDRAIIRDFLISAERIAAAHAT